jgi:predicted dehydrogenase
MKRRHFLKTAAAGSMAFFLPASVATLAAGKKVRIAQIGLGMMGVSDLHSMASHSAVEVVALCDVDLSLVDKIKDKFPKAKVFQDYRQLFKKMGKKIDAVVVSTTDHTHAPISLAAMNMNKNVYCQKPLTHYISESREMDAVAARKKLITQMGIQVHSFYDYKLASILIRGGIIGKVKKVIAWSPKVWGYDGAAPEGADPVPEGLNWDMWIAGGKKRPYKKGYYHPGNWRKCVDYGCGTLGDMGVHIFDTPYNALQLSVPLTVKNDCRKPNGFGHPEKNHVQYVFPGTPYTTDTLEWVWYDGKGAPAPQDELKLPKGDPLPDQGAMFIGEDGRRLLLPHFMQLPRLIVSGTYQTIDIPKFDPNGEAGKPTVSYDVEGDKHYHEFIDACLGKAKCSAPFSYSAKLTEVILLGVIAAQFPGQTLNWDGKNARFKEEAANKYLKG